MCPLHNRLYAIAARQKSVQPRYTNIPQRQDTRRPAATSSALTTVVPWTGAQDRRLLKRVQSLTTEHQALLAHALADDGQSLTELINLLTPVVQTRVARKLLSSAANRDLRQDVKDYTQDVFLQLFQANGKILRDWQPERGMSLENYVGLVAERRVVSMLRSGKRNPWRESEALEDTNEPMSPEADVATHALHADMLDTLLDKLREALSPMGWRLFDLLYIQECTVEEVQAHVDLTPDAIYAWRSRLRKAARKCQQELQHQSTLKPLSSLRNRS